MIATRVFSSVNQKSLNILVATQVIKMDTDPKLVLDQFREFLIFCKQRLGLKKLPKIHWHTDDDVGVSRPSFGSFENETQEIKIGIKNRHPLDVMRTLAHELTHYKQFLNGELHQGSGETGSPAENGANAMAGIIMRDWNAAHEDMFKQDEIDEVVKENYIKLGGANKNKDGKAAKWINHMYDTLPKNPMNPDQIALVYGEGDDQGLALIELEPDHYDADTANIKWMQAYPQRQGVGRKALAELQELAAEAGVHLSLTAWKHGKVPERALKKFYKSMGFGQDTKSGQMKWTVPVTEAAADEVPQEVWEFIDNIGADDVGKERIGDYIIHFEGFTDTCQADALERTELPVTGPRHLDKYEDVYDEVRADFIGRESGNEPVASGLAGDELYPVFYAVFHKPVLDEADLNYINQYNEHGGSLEGYVVDTDQPQLMNYLTGQGASESLVKALQSRYSRVGIIRNMFVDEELRNSGIGSEMLEAAIDDAFSNGADAIILVADMGEDNTQLGKPLDKWYEGWGFKTVGSAGGDPVMVLDRGLTESWSKKYKKSINCSHPKGFSQKAHCAGRRARQAGKHTKSKSISEDIIDYQQRDRKHLDKCLVELCEMIVKGQQTDPDAFGMVAAAVVDPDHNQTSSTSTREDGKWKHAERGAIEKYNELYGDIPEGSIIVTTLSPCDNAMSDRYGHSCTDLINQCPINEVYCGYMDPSQLDEDFEFKVEDTKNPAIQELCKKFAATFLVNENFADGKGPGRPGDSQRHGIPKGATIAQLEKAAKAPGRKGQLARWQLNMRRGRAKNESVVTEGTLAFHSSATPSISKFNSFSHFGTEKAAVDRIKNLVKQKRISPDALITIYSVDINIKNPLMIRDYANVQHSAGVYAGALKDKKIIDQDTMVAIRSNTPYDYNPESKKSTEDLAKLWPKYEKENLSYIKKILKSKGYDGLVYKNAAEDKGSLSYVILDPNQVRITGKKQIPARELIKAKTTEARAYMKIPSQFKDPITPVTFKSKVIAKFPDGDVVDTLHVLERMAQRGVYESALIQVINEAARHYSEKLRNMPSKGFVIKQNTKTGNYKGGVGAALHKNRQHDGTWKYVIKTVHHNFYVMDKNPEDILFVPPLTPKEEKNFLNLQKQTIKENSVLDKPTPTIGDLAEKYKTSLLAVKQQLVKGIRVEMEHTTKKSVAREIALDHLSEDLYYYKKLEKVEKSK